MTKTNIQKIEEDLHMALSLARGNSPAIASGARLDNIAAFIERALRNFADFTNI